MLGHDLVGGWNAPIDYTASAMPSDYELIRETSAMYLDTPVNALFNPRDRMYRKAYWTVSNPGGGLKLQLTVPDGIYMLALYFCNVKNEPSTTYQIQLQSDTRELLDSLNREIVAGKYVRILVDGPTDLTINISSPGDDAVALSGFFLDECDIPSLLMTSNKAMRMLPEQYQVQLERKCDAIASYVGGNPIRLYARLVDICKQLSIEFHSERNLIDDAMDTWLGAQLYYHFNPEKARTLFNRYLHYVCELVPSTDIAELLFHIGKAEMKRHIPFAVIALEKLIAECDESVFVPSALNMLTRIYAEIGQDAKAIQAGEKLIRLSDNLEVRVDVLYRNAVLYMAHQQFWKARENLKKLLQENVVTPEMYLARVSLQRDPYLMVANEAPTLPEQVDSILQMAKESFREFRPQWTSAQTEAYLNAIQESLKDNLDVPLTKAQWQMLQKGLRELIQFNLPEKIREQYLTYYTDAIKWQIAYFLKARHSSPKEQQTLRQQIKLLTNFLKEEMDKVPAFAKTGEVEKLADSTYQGLVQILKNPLMPVLKEPLTPRKFNDIRDRLRLRVAEATEKQKAPAKLLPSAPSQVQNRLIASKTLLSMRMVFGSLAGGLFALYNSGAAARVHPVPEGKRLSFQGAGPDKTYYSLILSPVSKQRLKRKGKLIKKGRKARP